MKLFHAAVMLAAMHWSATPDPVWGQAATGTGIEVEPADVFVRVELVRQELELIRLEMGKPGDVEEHITVANAAPRDVFFQALTLFRKANRLCYEQTREDTTEPPAPDGRIGPEHVCEVVNAALGRLRRVKQKLGIEENAKAPERSPATTPTDVFRSIVPASRQLNLLLDRQFAPSEVYQQVTLAISYASRLLALFPGATRIPPTPPFERRKRPADVYDRLIDCFELFRGIDEQLNITMVEVRRAVEDTGKIAPGDVYDIATLLLSELAFIHAQSPGAAAPVKSFYPGRKLPSHVYQRAGMLQTQLRELEKRLRENPHRILGSGSRL